MFMFLSRFGNATKLSQQQTHTQNTIINIPLLLLLIPNVQIFLLKQFIDNKMHHMLYNYIVMENVHIFIEERLLTQTTAFTNVIEMSTTQQNLSSSSFHTKIELFV